MELNNSLDRYVRKGQPQIANQFEEFIEWFVVQAIASAFVNAFYSPFGFLVNVGFLLYTGWGFLSEIGNIAKAWENGKVAKLGYAIMALALDILLNIYIT